MAFGCIILSIALGYIFSLRLAVRYLAPGGGTYGYRVNEWLIGMLGTVGTGLKQFCLTAFPLPFIVHHKNFPQESPRVAAECVRHCNGQQ